MKQIPGIAADTEISLGVYRCAPAAGGGPCVKQVLAVRGDVSSWTTAFADDSSPFSILVRRHGVGVVCAVRVPFHPWVNAIIPGFGRTTELLQFGQLSDDTTL